ncbi:transcriptional regulator DegA [Anaerocolumna aminovalerica]|uniref:Transcriptional regulator, LacI family n=1 Tax=Anaerocolumna aminovalerica TaxID=1527 RepID=A0A1I5HNX0_9FIRM|nr:LacI family DNA-binding transcriptional regulator [Anaerocolumna aminovalerica]MBU5333542.1 LacI family transcriptional regulator [Anaerocolumna aminovalerica]MDU6265427.1 LacI family DNA-binding transcriptional regulator [Anaerocolumna aminovalerica]SFO49994.1 transcriptional regulator, LacI family [Anaerocolumna aminovalerica]
MNIYDVADKAGVSIATVSRVINGNQNVSEKTKEKVLSIMKELGYTPNVFARGLGLNTMNTVGIMCTDSSDPFLANAVYYIEQELRKNGYDSFLCCTGYELKNKQNYLNLLLSKRIDAVILIGSSYLESNVKDNSYIMEAAKEVPVMLINGYLNKPNIYCTLCDDQQATYNATSLLLKEGRKNILYLYTTKSYSGIQKMKGYKEAILTKQSTIDEVYIQSCPNNIEKVKDRLLKLSEDGLVFDGIVTSEDLLAVGSLKYAKTKGISVPEELSIIGYNNSILASCCEPELTSVDNHVETLSLTTVGTLMRVLSGNTVPNRTVISTDLIIRNTTNFSKDIRSLL